MSVDVSFKRSINKNNEDWILLHKDKRGLWDLLVGSRKQKVSVWSVVLWGECKKKARSNLPITDKCSP